VLLLDIIVALIVSEDHVFKIVYNLLKEGNKHHHDYIKRINMHVHNTTAEETE
jgi:hypothetical protein